MGECVARKCVNSDPKRLQYEIADRQPPRFNTVILFLAYMNFELDKFVFGRVLNEGKHYLYV